MLSCLQRFYRVGQLNLFLFDAHHFVEFFDTFHKLVNICVKLIDFRILWRTSVQLIMRGEITGHKFKES